MDMDLEKFCPYAPPTSVLTVIRHMRERDLKEPVTSQWITTISVSEGNASRTIQALRFLDLLDEAGYTTSAFKAIGQAPDEEYPGLLAQTLQNAYKLVFKTHNVATATDQQLENAFRYYQPRAQRQRMIMLFKGLCREAGIIAGGPPEATPRSRTSSPKSNGARKPQPQPSLKTDAAFQGEPLQDASQPDSHPLSYQQEYALVQGLVSKLPPKKQWTQQERMRWLRAVSAMVDVLIEVTDPSMDGPSMEEMKF